MASLAPAEKAPAGKPLKVGSPHDPAEREADRIADILTAPEEPAMPVCAACAVGGAPCPACGGDGGGVLRRQVAAGGDGDSSGEMVAPPSVHRVLSEPGEPLPAGIRGKFERRLGADLGGVRVHTNRLAALAANEVNALAFAVGKDLVFGDRQLQIANTEGQRLIAHELAHVLMNSERDQRVDLIAPQQRIQRKDPNKTVLSGPRDPNVQQRHSLVQARLASSPNNGFAIENQEECDAQLVLDVRDRMQAIRRQVQTSTAAELHADQAPLRNYWAGYNLAVNRLNVQRQDALATALASAGTVNPTRTPLPTLDAAARDLTTWLAMPNPMAHKEQIFRTLLLVRDQRSALQDAFQSVAGRSLNTALDAGLSGHDLIRAQRYRQYGTLRLADKLYFAAEGAGTDEDTFYRLLRQAHAQRSQVESDFQADYSETYSRDGTLTNGQASRIAGLLNDEFSDWELDKAKALFTYGELRPVDNIRIATNRVGTEETMLFAALEACNRQTVRADYRAVYHEDLDALLDSELSGDDKKRADLILQGRLNAFERIRLAVKGWGTDEQAIYDAIAQASDIEREQLKNQFNNSASALYKMLDDDLSSSEMERVRALLERGSTAEAQLQQAGATGFSDIVDAIKMSRGQAFQTYKEAYNSDRGFQGYLRKNTRVVQYVEIGTLLNGSVESRLQWAIEGTGTDEDYIFHVLENFTDDAVKQRIRSNPALMAELRDDLSSTEFGRVQDLLRPSNLGLEAGVEEIGDRIERDRSWITDIFSNAADALSDEHRELQAALDRARVDGEISPEERAEIEQFQTQTEASLEVYRTVRDDLANTASTILTTAAALIVAVLTGGLASGASAAIIAAQLAQAALVSALARVAALKVIQGERFDVFGADGAIAFGTGAIDGVMNVLGASAAQAVVGPMLRTAGRTAAQESAEAGFNSLGRRLLTEAVEGGISGAASSVFETAANETTWKRGFEAGISAVAINTGAAAVTGAGMSTGISGLGHARSRWRRRADASTGGGGLSDTGTSTPHGPDASSPPTPTGTSSEADGGHAHGSADFPGTAHAEGIPQPRSPVDHTVSSPRSIDVEDTISNIPRPLLEGMDEWPEGLVHYGLDSSGSRQSYRASLEADPGREAGIWMDPTTGEHVVVQGGDTFVTVGWQREADFSSRPWVLVEHFHPGDDLVARFASEADFAAMMNPQLTGRMPPGPVSTAIRWRDPVSRLEFITEIGYNPDLPSPFWIRYRDANGDWQVHMFDDVPWNTGSDYGRFLQSHGIPASTISGGHSADTEMPGLERPVKVGQEDLDAIRQQYGIDPGLHTLAVGRTDVSGLEGLTFEGASRKIRQTANIPRPSEQIISPRTHRGSVQFLDHAEQDIVNQFIDAVERAGIKEADLEGHVLAIHISESSGVCGACKQGLTDTGAPPGILAELSQRYRGLVIRVTWLGKDGKQEVLVVVDGSIFP